MDGKVEQSRELGLGGWPARPDGTEALACCTVWPGRRRGVERARIAAHARLIVRGQGWAKEEATVRGKAARQGQCRATPRRKVLRQA
jgi:hypothetical protein